VPFLIILAHFQADVNMIFLACCCLRIWRHWFRWL